MTKTHSKKIASGVAGLLTAVCMACPALAATLPVTVIDPAGGAANVATSGSVTSTTVGNTQTYNQTTPTAIVEHSSYNVSWNGTVNYTNSSSATVMKTLARIYDKSPSQIFGTINDPHGILILANQNGIHFGNGSHVNVGGLIATTSAISNGDFDAGNYNFTAGRNPNATVINDGTIKTKLTTADGAGLVAFLAPTVKNNGYIEAKAGTVVLAGGDTATFVDLYGDGLINLATNGEVEHILINNKGIINANGGDVRLTAGTAKTVVDSLINMDGIIYADKAVTGAGGKVTLEANAVEMEGGCLIPATIIADGGDVKVTGFGATNLNHTAGVLMDNALIYAGNGKVSVWGKGYEGVKDDAATHNTGENYGVVMKNGSKIMTDGVDSKIFIAGFGGNGYGINDGKTNQSTNDNHGVFITGEGTKVTSEGGDIYIFGQGGGKTATFGSSNDYGVFINDGAKIASYDKAVYPEVDAKETMLRTKPQPTFVGGDVTIVGFGGGSCQWCGYDYGVYIKGDVETKRTRHGTETEIEVSSVTSESGDINIWGVGGGGDVGSYGNFGVFVDEYGNVGSQKGDIRIFGVGGKGDANSIYNYGVLLNNHASVTNHKGDITITGLGGGDQSAANNNYGIVMYDESFVGGKNFDGDYDGGPVIMSYVGGGEGGGHDHGDIRFITDTILFDDTVRVKTTGDVYFEPFHDWTTIGIAGAPGTLQLTKTVLDDVYARTVTIGNTWRDYGKITMNAYDWRMPVSVLNGGRFFFPIGSEFGDIVIAGLQTINGENTFYGKQDNTFRAVTSWGDIYITQNGGVVSLGGGGEPAFRTISEVEGCECGPDRETLITLAASFGRFINEAGPGALDAGNGRWVVYSFGPYDDVFGGLNSDNEAVWGRVYNKYHPLSDSWYPGNRYVFTVKPILTVTFDPMTKLFGTDATAAVAADTFSVDYTVRDLHFAEHPLLPTITDAFLFSTDTVTVDDITSAGSPPPASVGDYDILAGYVGDAYGSHVRQVPGTLTVYALPLNNVLDRSKAPGRRGPSGTLLSIVNNPLADLAPAAGGTPTNLADLSPKAGGDLANLSPQAGGGASITPLIQCNEVTPCDINQ